MYKRIVFFAMLSIGFLACQTNTKEDNPTITNPADTNTSKLQPPTDTMGSSNNKASVPKFSNEQTQNFALHYSNFIVAFSKAKNASDTAMLIELQKQAVTWDSKIDSFMLQLNAEDAIMWQEFQKTIKK